MSQKREREREIELESWRRVGWDYEDANAGWREYFNIVSFLVILKFTHL